MNSFVLWKYVWRMNETCSEGMRRCEGVACELWPRFIELALAYALPASADSATLHSCVLWVIISRMGPVRFPSWSTPPDKHISPLKIFTGARTHPENNGLGADGVGIAKTRTKRNSPVRIRRWSGLGCRAGWISLKGSVRDYLQKIVCLLFSPVSVYITHFFSFFIMNR